MKIKALFVGLLLAFACSSSPKEVKEPATPYTSHGGDPDAVYMQPLMDNAVKFEERIKVKLTPTDAGKQWGLVEETLNFKVSGSGVIVDSDSAKKRSMVLTAWHVCDTYPVGYKVDGLFSTLEVTEDKQLVLAVDEKEISIRRVLYRDKYSDTCVVEVNHYFPHRAVLADKMPPRGAFVDVVGAPEGNWGSYAVGSERGRFQGFMTIYVVVGNSDERATKYEDFAYYGFAGVGGFSGSGIYYKGKLIGLHTAGSTNFEHSSFGPALEAIKTTLRRAYLVKKYD